MRKDAPLDWDRLRADIAQRERSDAGRDALLEAARTRFLATAPRTTQSRPSAPGPRARAVFAVAVAAGVALALASRSRVRRLEPVSAEIEGETARVGAVLAAPPDRPRPIRFSDGSVFSMAAATRARVDETGPRGATLRVEEGILHAAVIHREGARWRVLAGPYAVMVTGTKFDIRWSDSDQVLALDLREGTITVTGPSLGQEGRRMGAGETLRVCAQDVAVDTRRTDGAESPAATVGSEHTPATRPTARRGPVALLPNSGSALQSSGAPPRSSGAATPQGLSWKALALAHRYGDAFAAAEAENFDAICRQGSASDLLLLGNTARLAGSFDRAEQAFRVVRGSFPGTHSGAMAAFSLGRIASDERRAFAEAADWFEHYLNEEPGGALAREASGRLIEAYRGAGNLAAAREASLAYLSKYPAGPHAALARSLTP